MDLLADRFLRDASRFVDLATGREVIVRRLPLGTSEEQRAWADACAGRLGVRRDGQVLVEFGYLGRSARFEAYESKPVQVGSETSAATTMSSDSRRSGEAGPPEWAAALTQLAELLEAGRAGRWRFVTVRLRDEDSRDPFMYALAHRARLSGFVPVRRDLLGRYPALLDRMAGLHVLLIQDETARVAAGGCDGTVCGVLDLALRNARPNVVLSVRCDPQVRTTGVEPTLQRPESGEQSSRSRESGQYTVADRSLRAAEAAQPYEAAWTSSVMSQVDSTATVSVVAPRSEWPLVQVARGLDLSGRGLHAAGERYLRRALGAFLRRRAPEAAGATALALGRLLRGRGRSRDAVDAFDQARRSFGEAGALGRAAEATAWLGWVRVDEGQLFEAEAALRAAQAAAREAGAGASALFARVGLARCLMWQAELDEAEAALAVEGGVASLASVRLRVAARLALLRDDLEKAGQRASEALEWARTMRDARALAAGHALMACLQGRLGHGEAVAEHVRRGVAAAREGHAPLAALAVRLGAIDGWRAAGRDGEARRVARRVARYPLERLPALLRARAALALAPFLSAEARAAAEERLETFVRTSGARALAAARQERIAMDLVQDVIEVLRVCQEAADEERALANLCLALRHRTGAAAVVVRAADPPDLTLSCVGPARPARLDAVDRALATGLPVPPGRYSDGIEAAAPVRYGGRTIGALGCRWPIDAVLRAAAAASLLTAAATASAPAVQALVDRRRAAREAARPEQDELGLLGVSAAMAEVRRQVLRAAAAAFPVLIEGESGVGKELAARAIHRLSARRDRRFAAVNCAALPDELLEAELFGHSRGAFTGALTDRPGLFEEADRGVLFLDEVSELSARAQAKVLRALQEGEVRRLGENAVRRVDVRVVAATNRPLGPERDAGRFRRDLYYRLAVIPITIPPLRERPEDVPVLARHFWAQAAAHVGSSATLAPETLAALARYDWPGNVRELQNVMAVLAVNGPPRGCVAPDALPTAIAASARVSATTLEEARRAFERRFVRAALARAGGHRGRAAAELGLSRQGLTKLLRRLRLDEDATAFSVAPRTDARQPWPGELGGQ